MNLRNFYTSILQVGALSAFVWLQVLFFGSVLMPGHVVELLVFHTTETVFLIVFVGFIENKLFDSWTKCHYSPIPFSRVSIYITTAIILTVVSIVVVNDTRPRSISATQLFSMYAGFYLFFLFLAGMVSNFSRVAGKNWVENIVLGRYHVPVIEERIFMFVDLTDSTLISHLLGDKAFSYLIKDFFREIDSAVSRHHGTIYQYAGDELLVHWPSTSSRNFEDAFNAFTDLSFSLGSKEAKYRKLYGLSPKFKAALHSGKVVVTWVGQSKKEILYQGEVLNITARITELAKKTTYPLVVSKEFFDGLGQKNSLLKYIGNFPIRGLETSLALYGYTSAVKQNNCFVEMDSSQN